MKKSSNWTAQEDKVLTELCESVGDNWEYIAQSLSKSFKNKPKDGKQCRQRWMHVLDPKINKDWTLEETVKLFQLHEKFGNKWAAIGEFFDGKSDNIVKDHFFSTSRRYLRRMFKLMGIKNGTQKINKIKSLLLCLIVSEEIQEQQLQKYELEDKTAKQIIECLTKNASTSIKNLTNIVETSGDKIQKKDALYWTNVISIYKQFHELTYQAQKLKLASLLRHFFMFYKILEHKCVVEEKPQICFQQSSSPMENAEEQVINQDQYIMSFINSKFLSEQ